MLPDTVSSVSTASMTSTLSVMSAGLMRCRLLTTAAAAGAPAGADAVLLLSPATAAASCGLVALTASPAVASCCCCGLSVDGGDAITSKPCCSPLALSNTMPSSAVGDAATAAAVVVVATAEPPSSTSWPPATLRKGVVGLMLSGTTTPDATLVRLGDVCDSLVDVRRHSESSDGNLEIYNVRQKHDTIVDNTDIDNTHVHSVDSRQKYILVCLKCCCL